MYEFLSSSLAQKQWSRIGIQRRAGVCAPLFSVYSRKSIGLADLRDLELLVDWCASVGMSILQLLPMNDVGFAFTPYDAQSSIALEPMYLVLDQLIGISGEVYSGDITALGRRFPAGKKRVDYSVKQAKLELLWKMFQAWSPDARSVKRFRRYCSDCGFWINDYALFKVIKERTRQAPWEEWEPELRDRNPKALRQFSARYADRVAFHQWLQWQLYEQFKKVKQYGRRRNVLLMGDLPFLVSRDSVEVWRHRDYFSLDFSAGAPPDAYFADGQRWGMAPNRWDRLSTRSYDLVVERLRYAEHFYDLFRIDHAVGAFRIWTIPLAEPLEHKGRNGFFYPPQEELWEAHGRALLSVMTSSTQMLPCAEDLGTVPACSWRVLEEFGIPGMDVQRWMKDSGQDYVFRSPDCYRKNSIAVISTHDLSPLRGWWEHEAGTVDEALFRRYCEELAIPFELVREQLFDLTRSRQGRLRWRKEIATTGDLVRILGRQPNEVGSLVYLYQSSYDEKNKFWRSVGFTGECEEACPLALVRRALEKVSEARSIFSVQLLADWLALDPSLAGENSEHFRINVPGQISRDNWSRVLPFSLEEMAHLGINHQIQQINSKTGRS